MPVEPAKDCEASTARAGLKVCVLMGGVGGERQVSLESGRCVAEALRRAGVDVFAADVDPERLDVLGRCDVDVFFVALHGQFGEDGVLQQILEDRSLVYTGSGPQASRLAFDKWAAKQLFAQAGIPTPPAVRYDPGENAGELREKLLPLGGRYVVKPLRQGSTIGVSIEETPQAAAEAARRCYERFGECMIERYVPGREVTVGILLGRALPIIEIRSAGGFYDYHAKYVDERTRFLFDTIEDKVLAGRIQQAGLDCFNVLGCRHLGRVDFILGDDGRYYVLELNTIPGMTEHSLLPKAAAKAGISMSRLCVSVVESAVAGKSGRCCAAAGGSK